MDLAQSSTVVAGLLVLALVVLLSMSFRLCSEYERGVVFRLGRLTRLRGPGLFLIIPMGVDRLFKVDLRVITIEVPPQEVITKDDVTIQPAQISGPLQAIMYYSPAGAADRALLDAVFNQTPALGTILTMVCYTAVFAAAAIRFFRWE
jgi:hypothetical protein